MHTSSAFHPFSIFYQIHSWSVDIDSDKKYIFWMGIFEFTDSKVALNISQKQNYSEHEVPVTQFCKNFQVSSTN